MTLQASIKLHHLYFNLIKSRIIYVCGNLLQLHARRGLMIYVPYYYLFSVGDQLQSREGIRVVTGALITINSKAEKLLVYKSILTGHIMHMFVFCMYKISLK